MKKVLQMSLLMMSLIFVGCAGMKKSNDCPCGGGACSQKKECKMDSSSCSDCKDSKKEGSK